MSYATTDSATRQSVGTAITPEEIAEGLQDDRAASSDTARYAMGLGDDALILAQRLGWWTSRAPEMEEDIALGNIALDLLGHARFLLTYAGSADGRSEDDLAYFRPEEEFRSCRLVEQPNGDFAHTIARGLLFSQYAFLLHRELTSSSDSVLGAIADKALKEITYHRDHATQWTLRLGDGTEESHARMQAGLDHMWPYVEELFTDEELHDRLAGIAVRPSTLRAEFDRHLAAVLAEATLAVPDVPPAMPYGGIRSGAASEHRGYILAEMQSLARQHPGASW
ncbi:1,2-phenylacetyl-CoA epoxidase subunit PaaC [Raineyella sp.]|nr:1,2-phenylacetyl-CoA epoxidase subunit PaaC [Raineyella sp.]MEA5153673.1 1,2-phenylacetyl-CoA epoxidase subunit PaaC [Raineyella sp.]